eukprot:scaffold11885_cov129-Isochrysis_galbana.AAC.6
MHARLLTSCSPSSAARPREAGTGVFGRSTPGRMGGAGRPTTNNALGSSAGKISLVSTLPWYDRAPGGPIPAAAPVGLGNGFMAARDLDRSKAPISSTRAGSFGMRLTKEEAAVEEEEDKDGLIGTPRALAVWAQIQSGCASTTLRMAPFSAASAELQ